MFFTLKSGNNDNIETSKAVQYWKDQFSKQVLVEINKGWKLVYKGTCIRCYSRVKNHSCIMYFTGVEHYDWMSYRQFTFQKNRDTFRHFIRNGGKTNCRDLQNSSCTDIIRDYFVDLDETSLTPFEYETRKAMWHEDPYF